MQNYKIETDFDGREITTHGTSAFPCGTYDERFSLFFNQEVPWHWHEEIEVVLVVEGATLVQCTHSEAIVKSGEMVFINSNTLHRLTNHGEIDCHILNVVFHPAFFTGHKDSPLYKKQVLPITQNEDLLMYVFSPNEPWQNNAIEFMRKAFAEWQHNQADKEFCLMAGVMSFWHEFYRHLTDTQTVEKRPVRYEKRLHLALDHVHKFYASAVSVEDIAKAANVSESECFRLFKNSLQTTPNGYLSDYRLRMAAQYLVNSQKPISIISEQTGFNSPAYFAKQFKKQFGKSPFEFRRENET